MDAVSFEGSVLPKLLQCRDHLAGISKVSGGSNIVLLAESAGLFEDVVYGFHQVTRKLERHKDLLLIVDSHGGSIDDAYTIATLCKERFGSFRVMVPFMAKSAATLLVLAADERLLADSALLGPVDPQVRHPERRIWFPAHAIREALSEAEATQDQIVKMAMADKLDPFLIGSYKESIAVSVQYITEVVESWDISNKEDVISAFTDKYRSHGYPMSRRVLQDIKVPYSDLNQEQEDMLYELHDSYSGILQSQDSVIIVSQTDYVFYVDEPEFRTSGVFIEKERYSSDMDGTNDGV